MKNINNSRRKFIFKIILMMVIMIIFSTFILNVNKAKQVTFAAESNNIIPKPQFYEKGEGKYILNENSSIYVKGKTEEETEEIYKIAGFLKEKLKPSTGFELSIIKSDNPPTGSIYLTTLGGEENKGNESYKIITTKEKVAIIAYKPEGISRGVQTLRQLLPAEVEKNTLVTDVEWSIPVSQIDDKPEYGYRGLMIDVARKFFDINEVKRQIDNAALASYGFLNEDGKKKPLYTGIEVGFSSFMTHDEKTYEFIEDVIKEISEISPSKYIHIGGDEAESTKKEDYDYFVGRVTKIVKKYGKTPIGWDPIDTSSEINSSVVLQNWKDTNAKAREKNMKMIISIAKKAYLDMKYNESTPYGLDWAGYIPVETAYNWDPTDFAPKELILGVESPLWTEIIKDRSAMDYMIYPRLLGYAEIGWTPKESRNWNEYKIRLDKQGERMKNQGINYYKGI